MTENLQIDNKSLSIRVSTNGLSFCVYAPGTEQPFTYKEHDMNHTISLAANLKEALMTEPMLQQQYKRVNVLVTNPHCTTVPIAHFKQDEVQDVYALNFPKDSMPHVSYNVLRRSGVALVFGLDKRVYQLIIDDFPRARFYASPSTLIEFFSERATEDSTRKMFVYHHGKEMTLFAFSMDRLQFLNSFHVNTVADMQYYALNVWQQLGMDQVDDAMYVVGDNDMCQEFADKVQYFIHNVKQIDRKDDFKTRITRGNEYIPYDLQTLLVCGF